MRRVGDDRGRVSADHSERRTDIHGTGRGIPQRRGEGIVLSDGEQQGAGTQERRAGDEDDQHGDKHPELRAGAADDEPPGAAHPGSPLVVITHP
ncbi:hypothetical protein [Cellulomonas sp. P24]|uniref:hypothetical protein n=1 Tax=Cellulomonas sp. P24 TaxID=2885206 RepID=UPI00216B3D7A|nr:hypothetical protein [Cellulomonas sp. P24]MCR6493633.1 hypothetical protein [Cellulomonas sp. P24]